MDLKLFKMLRCSNGDIILAYGVSKDIRKNEKTSISEVSNSWSLAECFTSRALILTKIIKNKLLNINF